MDILYQFNEKYAPYAAVSMTSLFENNKSAENICVYVLCEEVTEDSKERLSALSQSYNRQIVFIDTAFLICKMKELNMPTYRGSYAANMRLFVDYIFENVSADDFAGGNLRCSDKSEGAGETGAIIPKRLLYLDADTIVTADLSGLFEYEIKTLGMVYDLLGNAHKYEIGLTKESGYYNSGVILYDVDKWISEGFTGKIIEHVKNVRAQYPSPDQDLLNVVLKDEITPLPFEYNFQPHLRDFAYESFMKCFNPTPFYSAKQVAAANKNPVILHAYRYLGEFPWHKDNLHPFRKKFDVYLAISTFNDYVKLPSGGGIVVKTEKLLYKKLPRDIFLRVFKLMHGLFYRRADKLSKSGKISSKM